MDNRRRIRGGAASGRWRSCGCRLGVFVTAAVLFWTAPEAWTPMLPESAASLAPCGLPLALACRQLWRLGWRPARDSRLGGRSEPPGLDGVMVAPREGLKPTGAGPVAQQGGVELPLPGRD